VKRTWAVACPSTIGVMDRTVPQPSVGALEPWAKVKTSLSQVK
jgi:hypothetical protein